MMVNIDEVRDFKLDGDFDIFIDHRGDLATVSGREAFEQKLIVRIQENFTEQIGRFDKENIKDLLLLETERIAEEQDQIDRIAAFSAAFSDEKPNTVEITIVYDTGDELTFEVAE